MNPVLADIYSTVIPAAPFVIAAYAMVWIVLVIYVAMVVGGLRKSEAQIALLEEQFKRIGEGSSGEGE